MPVSMLSLNIAHAHFTLDPESAPQQEFPATTGKQYQPESGESGGTQFSNWRRVRAAAYVQDALPTETGYVTFSQKAVQPFPLRGGGNQLLNVIDCDGKHKLCCVDELYIKGVAHHPRGTIIWWQNGTITKGSSNKALALKGIRHDAPIKSMVGAAGRVVIATDMHLYWSSSVDPTDFVPSIGNGAGSATHTFDIGRIVKLVSNAAGMYVLGTSGGMCANCTGDVRFPYELKPISNFNGIPYYDAVHTNYEADRILVWSNAGLMWLSGCSAEPVFPDISMQLQEGVYSHAEITRIGKSEAFTDPCEYRDSVTDCAVWHVRHVDMLKYYKVHNVSPRYTVISYDLQDSDIYGMVYVEDLFLRRCAVLRLKHFDVNVNEHFGLVFSTGPCKSVGLALDGNGLGLLLMHNLTTMSARSFVLSKIRQAGKFNPHMYDLEGHNPLAYVYASQGVDLISSDSTDCTMSIVHASKREVQYAGKLRQMVLHMTIPFSGWLSNVFLEIA